MAPRATLALRSLLLLACGGQALADGTCSAELGRAGSRCAQEQLLLQTRTATASVKQHSALHQHEGEECCAPFGQWPSVDNGVTCPNDGCTALVLTAPYGGKCADYCQSFGHVCVSAAEEIAEGCGKSYVTSCDAVIAGTSDMLCKCRRADAGGSCADPLQRSGSSASWWSSGQVRGSGWCTADVPAQGWSLHQQCGNTRVRVLSYNLFWWNLFDRRGGNGNSAGNLIASRGGFDIIGFQECDNVHRILHDAGLGSSHQAVDGGRAIAIAFAKDTFELIADGARDVAEDRSEQYYGRRSAQWVRLRHRASGKEVFFMNHHGPLPVNTGGVCGGTATAYNILKTMADNSQPGDAKMLVGDFNADAHASTQSTLANHMHRAGHHWVDGIYGSCPGSDFQNLGRGGSDHDAIAAVFNI